MSHRDRGSTAGVFRLQQASLDQCLDQPLLRELCDQLVSNRPTACYGAGGIDVNQNAEQCWQHGVEGHAFGLLQVRQERFGAPANGPAQAAEVVVSRRSQPMRGRA